MNRRDNFQGIINHWEPERVLIDFGKHIGSFHRNAYERFKSDLGTKTKTRILDRMAQNVVLDERNCEQLGIDFRWIIPHWVGVRDVEMLGQPSYVDMWKTPHQWTTAGNY